MSRCLRLRTKGTNSSDPLDDIDTAVLIETRGCCWEFDFSAGFLRFPRFFFHVACPKEGQRAAGNRLALNIGTKMKDPQQK